MPDQSRKNYVGSLRSDVATLVEHGRISTPRCRATRWSSHCFTVAGATCAVVMGQRAEDRTTKSRVGINGIQEGLHGVAQEQPDSPPTPAR